MKEKRFMDIPIVLLLTKPDILKKSLESGIELKHYFPQYQGNFDFFFSKLIFNRR